MATFSESLFQRIQSIYDRILAHPFLTGLTDGTLSEAAFRLLIVECREEPSTDHILVEGLNHGSS